jgi:hypothetical protein
VNRYFEDNKDSSSWSGTTGLFRAAIDTTLQRSTSNLLDQYPQTVHVYNEFGEEDYLAGQTTVFTGDPKTPFNGLNNDEGGATGTSSSPASAGQNPPAAPPATASSTGAK